MVFKASLTDVTEERIYTRTRRNACTEIAFHSFIPRISSFQVEDIMTKTRKHWLL
jgi:hypothetical protein